MSSKELLNISIKDFNKMSAKELAKAVNTLKSTANKRIKRFKEAGVKSPALTKFLDRSNIYDSKDTTNINRLRSEFMSVKNFLESPTGSLRGYKKIKKQVTNTLLEHGVDIRNVSYDDFFELYEKLKDYDRYYSSKDFRYNTFDVLSEMMVDGQVVDFNELLNNLQQRYENTEGW